MKIAASLLLAVAFGTPAFAEDFAPVALNSLTATPLGIISAPVMNQTGKVIGQVKGVATDQDGRPSAISYVVGSNLVVIAAPAVSYDAQKNIVVADTSKATIGDLVAVN